MANTAASDSVPEEDLLPPELRIDEKGLIKLMLLKSGDVELNPGSHYKIHKIYHHSANPPTTKFTF